MTFSADPVPQSTFCLGRLHVAQQWHTWGSSDVPGGQPCSERPSAVAHCQPQLRGQSGTGVTDLPCFSLPRLILCLSSVPHKVTWPVSSLSSVKQLPHSSPLPQGKTVRHRADLILAISEAFGNSSWQELSCDTSWGRNQDTLGSNPAAQMLSAGRVTLSNQTWMLESDCRAAATDIALALGHPLHRMGRARKRGFGLHSIFAKLLPLTSS